MNIFKRKPYGLSFIEIITTLLIASLIVTLSIIEISDYFEQRRQYSYMQQLYHDLKWARADAIALNQPIKLQAFYNDWCAGWQIISVSQVLKEQKGLDHCNIVFSSSLGLAYFQFMPDGGSGYQNGHFYFYNEDNRVSMQIIINQVGRIRWES